MKLFLIATFGALGVLARYAITSGVTTAGVSALWPVLAVNVIGSMAAGFIYIHSQTTLSTVWSAALLVGLMGGFTTFSAYALDTMRLLQNSQWMLAAANVGLNNLLSLIACYIGLKLGEILL